MTEKEKASELVRIYGVETALEIIDTRLDQSQEPWNQKDIDFYLDVRLLVDYENN